MDPIDPKEKAARAKRIKEARQKYASDQRGRRNPGQLVVSEALGVNDSVSSLPLSLPLLLLP